MATKTMATGLLELKVDGEVEGATIPVRWCVNALTIENLKARNVKYPYLLVIVKTEEKEERYLVDLADMVFFIQLRQPGLAEIFGVIVWNPDGDPELKYIGLKERYLRREYYGKYYTDVISSVSGDLYEDMEDCLGQTKMEVMIPPELFAKEPPAWEKKWVNRWFSSSPRDQCDYRKRRIVAYSIQPPVMLLVFLFGYFIKLPFRWFLSFWTLIGGVYDINLKPLVRPYELGTKEIWWPVERRKNLWLRFFSWFWSVATGETVKQRREKGEQKRLEADRLAKERYEAALQKLLESLSCEKSGQPLAVVVPPSRRLYLWFNETKAKVCRPFAG